jgi:CheY-like chemotaxis protein
MMGGEIQVTSDDQRGTRFWFDLPLVTVDVPTPPAISAHVLLLEPSDASAENLQGILKELGCAADIVATPSLLLAALGNTAAVYSHLIISDNAKYDSNTVGASARALALNNPFKLVLLTLPITQAVSNDVFDSVLLRPVFAHDLRRALMDGDEQAALQRELPSADHPRILLAEDNQANQQMLLSMLEKMGYVPQAVPHGEAAVTAAGQRQFAAILLDFQMPVMDGLNAARLIREGENKNNQPPQVILGLTGNADEAQRAACLAAGMNDVLVKPIMMDTLQNMLQKYVRQHT